jgi:hypothetical protein
MINPTISTLLDGVATSLHETVLPELPPGFARNQLMAAIALIRRSAAVGDHVARYVWDDNHDIASVLSEVGPSLGLASPAPTLVSDFPSVDELRRANLALQAQLVEAHRLARADPGAETARAALRALFERMLARESRTNTSSWV